MAFYADNDVGSKIWELVNGPQGFFNSKMVKIGSFAGALPGQAVTVALQDVVNLGSDTRTIALVWDDARLDNVGRQDEGTTASYVVTSTGQTLSVWIDKIVPAQVQLLSKDDAKKVVADTTKTLAQSLLEYQQEQQAAMNRVLIGVGVVAVVLIVAAAYALPKVKIPNVSLA